MISSLNSQQHYVFKSLSVFHRLPFSRLHKLLVFQMELKEASDTRKCKHNEVIYCIYVRSHSEEGTFSQVTKDLARIASLGVDYIWLMPIHPIGKLKKKGRYCSYFLTFVTNQPWMSILYFGLSHCKSRIWNYG